MIETDFTFPHDYEIEQIIELPGTGRFRFPVHYLPQQQTRPEHDGLWITIHSSCGISWVGVFAFGYEAPPAISRILSSPSPGHLCIVSRGAAYFVKADDPASCTEIPVLPVIDVRTIPEHGLLVFASFDRLVAYSDEGLRWESPRICWDDLTILNVTSDSIEGVGYDPVNSGAIDLKFAVDIRTGQSLIPPPKSVDGLSVW